MSKKIKKDPPQPLQEGLFRALQALDAQISREMQRTPSERDEQGVTKWEPIQKRVEIVTSDLVMGVGSEEFSLEALCVLAQASSKALTLITEELGESGLGNMRTQYVSDTFEKIRRDLRSAGFVLGEGGESLPQ